MQEIVGIRDGDLRDGELRDGELRDGELRDGELRFKTKIFLLLFQILLYI